MPVHEENPLSSSSAVVATDSKLPTAVRLHHGEGAPDWMTSKQTGQPRLDVILKCKYERENRIQCNTSIHAYHTSQTIDNQTMVQGKPISCSAIDCTCCSCATYYTYLTSQLYLCVPVNYKLTPSGFSPITWRINVSNSKWFLADLLEDQR